MLMKKLSGVITRVERYCITAVVICAVFISGGTVTDAVLTNTGTSLSTGERVSAKTIHKEEIIIGKGDTYYHSSLLDAKDVKVSKKGIINYSTKTRIITGKKIGTTVLQGKEKTGETYTLGDDGEETSKVSYGKFEFTIKVVEPIKLEVLSFKATPKKINFKVKNNDSKNITIIDEFAIPVVGDWGGRTKAKLLGAKSIKIKPGATKKFSIKIDDHSEAPISAYISVRYDQEKYSLYYSNEDEKKECSTYGLMS